MNAKRNLKIIKAVMKEAQFPVSVIDEFGRVVKYRHEFAALKHLGNPKIINYRPAEYFLPPKT